MKTAVSIPDPLNAEAEAEAKRLGISRSKLHQLALEEFLKRSRDAAGTEEINRAIEKYGDPSDGIEPLLSQGVAIALSSSEWDE